MYRIRILQSCKLQVIDKIKGQDTDVIRRCLEGEDVYVHEISMEDVDNGMYAPHKQQILAPDGTIPEVLTPKEDKAVDDRISNIESNIAGLTRAVESVVDVVKDIATNKSNGNGKPKPKRQRQQNVKTPKRQRQQYSKIILPGGNEIPEDVFIDGDKPYEHKYSVQDYTKYHNDVRQRIRANVLDIIDIDPANKHPHEFRFKAPSIRRLPKFANTGNGMKDSKVETVTPKIIATAANVPIKLILDKQNNVNVAASLNWTVN